MNDADWTEDHYPADPLSGESVVIVRPAGLAAPFGLAYLDAPGPGALVASYMPAAGVDGHGNPYPAGDWRDETPRPISGDVCAVGWMTAPGTVAVPLAGSSTADGPGVISAPPAGLS